VGPTACPYNALYWNFLATHRERLSKNIRMKQLMSTLDRFGPEQVQQIRDTAQRHLAALEPSPSGWKFDEDAG
jgi:deoxyribodipyrimidine photolyase-related protein